MKDEQTKAEDDVAICGPEVVPNIQGTDGVGKTQKLDGS